MLEAGSGVSVGATGRTSSAKGVLGGWTAVSGTKHTQPKRKGGVPRPYSEVLKDALAGDKMTIIVCKCESGNVDVPIIETNPIYIRERFMEQVRAKNK